MCTSFYPTDASKIGKIQSAIAGMKSAKDINLSILTQIEDARRLNNKEYVFFFWHWAHNYVVPPAIRASLIDPESIRRSKQMILEKDHPEWKLENPTLTEAKLYKEWGVKEWVWSQK